MSDYTPSAEQVQYAWAHTTRQEDRTLTLREALDEFDRWLAARDEEKFLEGARWALRAEGVEDVDRAIQNIRDAQAVEEDA